MRCVSAVVFLGLAMALAAAQDAPADLNEKLNAVDTKPSVRLDPYIRKALLKALTELEEHENFADQTESSDESTSSDAEIFRTGDDNLTPTEATKDEIRIHSFIVNGQSAFNNNTNAKPTPIDDNITILTTTAGNVENQATLPTQTPFNEIFQTRESGINIQQVRSIASSKKTDSENSISKFTNAKPTTTEPTTTTTTTTTTPKPTHNDDGENIEDVDKRDVQFFQAPLVAAFTVHQDAQGKPKQVVPIYQQNAAQGVPQPTPSTLPASIQPPIAQVVVNNPQNNNENKVHPIFISQQISLQRQLEEKQRILEEQLRLLQIQQRQQEELLRKQQFLLQQKEAQRQQQLQFEQEQFRRQQILAEQQRLQASQSVNNFQLPLQNNQNQFQQQNNVAHQQNAQVQIQQSLEQPSALANQQQLPNREAVDFLIHLRNQQKGQFPLQENHLPQGISNFLQPGPVLPNFQQTNTFNQVRSLEDPFRQGNRQGNRVFRQESGVGNFGFNNQQNYNRFNTFNPVQQTNRFVPFNRQPQFGHGAELQQLLVQNGGLNGRAHEDLNIVTKVLSLNHGIPINNNISNRLPFDSRRHVRN